jgi:hypothetical protein
VVVRGLATPAPAYGHGSKEDAACLLTLLS